MAQNGWNRCSSSWSAMLSNGFSSSRKPINEKCRFHAFLWLLWWPTLTPGDLGPKVTQTDSKSVVGPKKERLSNSMEFFWQKFLSQTYWKKLAFKALFNEIKFFSKMFGIPNKLFPKAKLLFHWRRLGAPSVIKRNQNKDQL